MSPSIFHLFPIHFIIAVNIVFSQNAKDDPLFGKIAFTHIIRKILFLVLHKALAVNIFDFYIRFKFFGKLFSIKLYRFWSKNSFGINEGFLLVELLELFFVAEIVVK